MVAIAAVLCCSKWCVSGKRFSFFELVISASGREFVTLVACRCIGRRWIITFVRAVGSIDVREVLLKVILLIVAEFGSHKCCNAEVVHDLHSMRSGGNVIFGMFKYVILILIQNMH